MKKIPFYPLPALGIGGAGFVLMFIGYIGPGTRWNDFNSVGKLGLIMFVVAMAYLVILPFSQMIKQLFKRK